MKRIVGSAVLAMAAWMLSPSPAAAHNPSIHQAMTDLAWQMMVVVENTGGERIGEGGDDWQGFLRRVAATPGRYRTRPADLYPLVSSRTDTCTPALGSWNTTVHGVPNAPRWDFKDLTGCGVNTTWKPSLDNVPANEFGGAVLGVWAAFPDSAFDDTHLWYRVTSAAGLGAVHDIVNEATEDALTIALIPIVCAVDWLFGDGDDCVKNSRKIADDVNVTEEVDSWIPGVGDQSGDDWVGVWHFVDMKPGASNDFDARQGKLFDEAGVPGEPMDPVELVLMAYFDASGLSLNYDKSQGIDKYTADNADDGMAKTIHRDKADWQFTTIAHTPFEPVNNLAWYGWTHFRDEQIHPVSMLGWPLHAIGDAIVPMHVVGTSAWGHRPFEDSQDLIWDSVWNFKARAAGHPAYGGRTGHAARVRVVDGDRDLAHRAWRDQGCPHPPDHRRPRRAHLRLRHGRTRADPRRLAFLRNSFHRLPGGQGPGHRRLCPYRPSRRARATPVRRRHGRHRRAAGRGG